MTFTTTPGLSHPILNLQDHTRSSKERLGSDSVLEKPIQPSCFSSLDPGCLVQDLQSRTPRHNFYGLQEIQRSFDPLKDIQTSSEPSQMMKNDSKTSSGIELFCWQATGCKRSADSPPQGLGSKRIGFDQLGWPKSSDEGQPRRGLGLE